MIALKIIVFLLLYLIIGFFITVGINKIKKDYFHPLDDVETFYYTLIWPVNLIIFIVIVLIETNPLTTLFYKLTKEKEKERGISLEKGK